MAHQFDDFSIRMKEYEHASRRFFPKRMPILIRLDGKAFHTFTKGMRKPFDENLAYAFWETTKYLCENIAGAQVGYTQSDEITILVTNDKKLTTESWYNNNQSKMESVSASLATAKFNEVIHKMYPTKGLAFFDSRAFVLPRDEVCNNFIWRQQDATKNSVSMFAQAHFSHHELQGKNGSDMQDMLWKEKGINWNDQDVWKKRGMAIIKKTYHRNGAERMRFEEDWNTPIFSKNRDYITQFVEKKPIE